MPYITIAAAPPGRETPDWDDERRRDEADREYDTWRCERGDAV